MKRKFHVQFWSGDEQGDLSADRNNNSRLIKENVVEEIAKLKQQPGMDILLAGSGQLLRALLPHDLVDEYRIMLHPIILGSGKRLFADGISTKALRLVDTKTTSTGVVILTYHPAGSEAKQ
jgi:dihydrofolate reductase